MVLFSPQMQGLCTVLFRDLVPDIALCVLEKIYMDTEFKGSFIKSFRVTSEPYADRLEARKYSSI